MPIDLSPAEQKQGRGEPRTNQRAAAAFSATKPAIGQVDTRSLAAYEVPDGDE
jgi:hypothetical protein